MGKLTKATKKKYKYYLMVIGAASLVSLLVIFLFVGFAQFLKPSGEEALQAMSYNYSEIDVSKPMIEEMLLTQNINSRPTTPLKKVKGVVVHYTANPGTDAEANRNYFESRKDFADESRYKVSSHYIIGLDGTIIQCIPEEEIAYASNNRNSDTISIECCHPNKSGKFTEQTYQSLVHLVAYLCDKYTLNMDDIIRHYDVTGKECPRYYVKHPKAWKSFKSDIDAYLKKCTKEAES